jgi:hypothetical protein
VSYGAGSNIKTAEALLSGKYVIGTPVAFRGFENFVELPEVRVADGPKKIQAALHEVLKLPRLAETVPMTGEAPRLTLTWESALGGLAQAVEVVATRMSIA